MELRPLSLWPVLHHIGRLLASSHNYFAQKAMPALPQHVELMCHWTMLSVAGKAAVRNHRTHYRLLDRAPFSPHNAPPIISGIPHSAAVHIQEACICAAMGRKMPQPLMLVSVTVKQQLMCSDHCHYNDDHSKVGRFLLGLVYTCVWWTVKTCIFLPPTPSTYAAKAMPL